jgi:hypothetical protein
MGEKIASISAKPNSPSRHAVTKKSGSCSRRMVCPVLYHPLPFAQWHWPWPGEVGFPHVSIFPDSCRFVRERAGNASPNWDKQEGRRTPWK